MRLAQSIAVAAILALCFARSASPGVVFYVQDQPGFLAATASASLTLAGSEGFEASTLAPSNIILFDDPLVPGVANGTFPNGTGTSSGVAVRSNTLGGSATVLSPRGIDGLSTASAGFLGTPTDQVSSNKPDDSFDLMFAPANGRPARAICMAPLYFDAAATSPSSHPGDLEIKVYAADQTTLLGTQTINANYSQYVFLGIVSDGGDVIGRVNIWDGNASANYQGADDIQVWTAVPVANCRSASSVVAFSSQFDLDGWSAQQALGPPNIYPDYADNSWAWASFTPDDQAEFIELAFDDPAPINFINVYETYLPGAISSISVKNPNTSLFEVVWTGVAAPAPEASRLFTATFPETPYSVSEVRIDLDSPAVPGWNEIDAVSIGYCNMTEQNQWASSVVGFSSQYDSNGWAAQHAVGPPDIYPTYGDSYLAWASLTPDDQPEFLELAFNNPAPINFVSVVEILAPGALNQVSVKNPNTGLFEEVWSGTAAAAPPVPRIQTVSFPETRFLVSEVRLDFDSPAVPNWNEIDAVAVGRCGCEASFVDAPQPRAPRATNTIEWARPNPFTRSMGLGFSLSLEAQVKVDVFNVLGQRVSALMDRRLPAGRHEVQWDGRDALGRATASGVYYVRVEIDGVRQSRKIVKVD